MLISILAGFSLFVYKNKSLQQDTSHKATRQG